MAMMIVMFNDERSTPNTKRQTPTCAVVCYGLCFAYYHCWIRRLLEPTHKSQQRQRGVSLRPRWWNNHFSASLTSCRWSLRDQNSWKLQKLKFWTIVIFLMYQKFQDLKSSKRSTLKSFKIWELQTFVNLKRFKNCHISQLTQLANRNS